MLTWFAVSSTQTRAAAGRVRIEIRLGPRSDGTLASAMPNWHMADRLPLIAIVDDEKSMRLAIAHVLRASSYAVSVYPSGEDFLQSLPNGKPDCLVLDFHLPGLSGRDVQRALLNAQERLPIIVVTAYDQPALRERCLADGAVAYLTKPVRKRDLLAAVEVAIRGSAAR